MSVNEGTPLGEVKLSARDRAWLWVWGSIVATLGLWAFAAYHPFLKNLVATTDGKGQIGDFLGGVSAPVFGFVGMVLVYRSFQAQVKANQLQIDALKLEREAREQDEASKFIEDGLRRLEQIFERACYVRRDEGNVKNPYRGVDGIYRFCVDCLRNGDGPYSENEIMIDILRHWLLEGGRFLRLTRADFPDSFDHAVTEVSLLYGFTLQKSMKALLCAKPSDAFFQKDLEALQEVKEYFDKAQLGQFEPETPA